MAVKRHIGPPGALAPAMALVAACQDPYALPYDPPPVAWRGEHVDIRTDADLEAWTPSNGPWLDAFIGGLEEDLDAHSRERVPYSLFEEPVKEMDICYTPLASACAFPRGERAVGAIATSVLPDTHEAVHAVDDVRGGMPTFFEEGWATYLGGIFVVEDALDYRARGLDLSALIEQTWSDRWHASAEYALASHFVSYLVHTHGRDRFVELLHRGGGIRSRKGFERVLAEVYGGTLAELVAGYEADWSYCSAEAIRDATFECAGEAIEVPSDEWLEVEVDLSWDAEGVLGPRKEYTDDEVIWRDVVVEFPEEPQYHYLEVLGPAAPIESAHVRFKPCSSDCRDVDARMVELHDTLWPDAGIIYPPKSITAGRFVMRVSMLPEDGQPVQLRLR